MDSNGIVDSALCCKFQSYEFESGSYLVFVWLVSLEPYVQCELLSGCTLIHHVLKYRFFIKIYVDQGNAEH